MTPGENELMRTLAFRRDLAPLRIVKAGERPYTPLLERLVGAAVRAPSGANTQPWRFVLDHGANRISIFTEGARDPSPMNIGERMTRVSCGAAVENLVRVAESHGWSATVDTEAAPALVQITLSYTGERSGDEGIERAIHDRCTNRRDYDGQRISPELIARLAGKTPLFDGVSTHWICDRKRIGEIARLIGKADGLLFSDGARRADFFSNLSVQPRADRHADEGIPIEALELSRWERALIRTLFLAPERMFKGTGACHLVARYTRRRVASASGLCIAVSPDGSRKTDLAVGRVLERAWLALTSEGLAAQPFLSVAAIADIMKNGSPGLIASLDRARVGALLDEFRRLVPELGARRPAFVMRFGFAPSPSARTERRPLDAVIADRDAVVTKDGIRLPLAGGGCD
jgi:sulfur-carrier protein adenylyltransferase/sulfurtransferase